MSKRMPHHEGVAVTMARAERPSGPRHDVSPPPTKEEIAERELQRADRCIADLRQRLGAIEQTLATVARLASPYAKPVDLSTRPIAPTVAARTTPHRSSIKQK
jgi:hypothetical protein